MNTIEINDVKDKSNVKQLVEPVESELEKTGNTLIERWLNLISNKLMLSELVNYK